MQQEMSEAALKARRRYMKEYYQTKVKGKKRRQYDASYWERRAEREAAEQNEG